MARKIDPPAPQTDLQWRQIVDSASDTGIISLDLEGRVTSWNTGACHILGWTEEEMLGQTLERLFADGGANLATEMHAALADGRGGAEGWRLRRDGASIWAAGEMSPIRGPDGAPAGFVKILRDRTAQRIAEETIREERRALEILNRAGSALAAETDLERLV